MCGICGIINIEKKPVEESDIHSMMSAIKHRGPDDEGTFINDNVGLGFVRLSILDLSENGHQPMLSNNHRYAIVYNGEIYNYIELKDQLSAKGYSFRSSSDTEVLLSAYIEWGEECLERFNGMFSFVIYDKKENKIFGARDRFGVKPFYYHTSCSKFLFASEIPGILAADSSLREPNDPVIYNYLVFNKTDIDNQTFFKRVNKLVHGHKINIELSSANPEIKITRWYNLKERIHDPYKNADEFFETFNDSVRLRLRSDVPVSVCLSGGLDSSSILSVMLKKYNTCDVHTFSAVYGEGKNGDESQYIHEYTSELKNMHYVFPTAEVLYKDLISFITAHTEPVQSTSIFAEFEVMRMVNQNNIKVAMIGQGADEFLGGYHYFFGNYFKEKIRKFQIALLLHEMYHYKRNHHSFLAMKYLLFYLMPANLQNRMAVRKSQILTGDFSKSVNVSENKAMKLYSSATLRNAFLDHFEYKLEHNLKWSDMNAMRFSVEGRMPFLDYKLVERTLATDSNLIISKGNTKFILREAMKGFLPEKIRTRQSKIGYETPENEWFRGKIFHSFIKEIITSSSFKSRGYIRAEKAQQLFVEHSNGHINISKDIWKWINLELWFRQFIDKS